MSTTLFARESIAPFILVCPVRNAEQYIERCLLSILDQSFTGWHTILVDDDSTDKTANRAINLVTDNSLERQFTIVRNSERKFALWNIFYSIQSFIKNKNSIVGIIDGDDWFSENNSLEKVWDTYADGYDFLWTQHICWPDGKTGYSLPADANKPRKHRRGMSHFKTFRKYLFDLIPETEFKDKEGHFFRYAYDKAITYPMSELAKKMYFLNEQLYIYNCENSNNVDKEHSAEQLATAEYLESKRPLNLSML